MNIYISLGTAAIPNTGGVRSKDDKQSQPVVHSQPSVNTQPSAGPQPGVQSQPEVHSQPSVNPQPSAGPQPGVQSQPDEHAVQTKFIAWSREIQEGKDLKCFFFVTFTFAVYFFKIHFCILSS